jgi:germination protein M
MENRALAHICRLIPCAVAVVIFGTLCGCSHQSTPPSQAVTPTPTPVAPAFNGNLTVYEIAVPNSKVQPDDNGLVPITVTVDPASRDVAREALDELAKSKQTPLPKGTSILGVKIDQSTGLATVNFSREFVDNFEGGDTREAQVLNSVLETLGQFSTIQDVQFLVGGKKIDSLGGTQDLNAPLPIVKSSSEASAGA